MFIRPGALGCAMLILITACGEVPLAPQSIAGTYVLVAVDGEPIPVTVSTDAANAITLVADTMRLYAAGSLEGRRCQRRLDYVRNTSTDSCSDYGGSYHVRVRTIELSIGCGFGQLCTIVALHSARLVNGSLIVSREVSGRTLTFRREPE